MRRLALPAWLVCLAIVLCGLVFVESATVPLLPLGGLLEWSRSTDAATVLLGVARGVCTLGVGYLLLISILATVAQLARSSTASSVVTAVCGEGLWAFNKRLIGLSLIGVLATPTSAGAATDAPVLRSLTPTTTTIATAPVPTAPVPTAPPNVATWTVAAGDNLWTIAESVVKDRLGVEPSEREIADYWLSLQAANTTLQDANVITPGEILTLPPA